MPGVLGAAFLQQRNTTTLGERGHITWVECAAVQIEGSPESLDDGHGAAATIHDAGLSGYVTQEAEDSAHIDADDRAAQVVIPGQLVAKTMRQTQHPLPHGHRWEHVVDQVRGTFGHPAPATALAKPPTLTRKRYEAIKAAPGASKTGEPASETSAAQKVAELLLDKSRQPFSVTQTRRLHAERLEVIADHLIEHTPCAGWRRPRRLGS